MLAIHLSGGSPPGVSRHSVAERFKLKDLSLRGVDLLEGVCRGRGFLMKGNVCDLDRGCAVVLDEFRAGKLGRITLEMPAPGDAAPPDALPGACYRQRRTAMARIDRRQRAAHSCWPRISPFWAQGLVVAGMDEVGPRSPGRQRGGGLRGHAAGTAAGVGG